MPKHTSHFWVGTFKSQDLLDDFFEEDYKDNENLKRPISKFAASQKEKWIDHDFLERGFENEEVSLRDKFIGYSYGEHWIDLFLQKIEEKGLKNANTIIMCSLDGDRSPVKKPVSFSGEGYQMEYLGTISYDYEHPQWFKDILNS